MPLSARSFWRLRYLLFEAVFSGTDLSNGSLHTRINLLVMRIAGMNRTLSVHHLLLFLPTQDLMSAQRHLRMNVLVVIGHLVLHLKVLILGLREAWPSVSHHQARASFNSVLVVQNRLTLLPSHAHLRIVATSR